MQVKGRTGVDRYEFGRDSRGEGIENKLDVKMERQNLDGKTIARREHAPVQKKRKAEAAKPKRGKKAVVDKRKAPKTGSNRRQNKNK